MKFEDYFQKIIKEEFIEGSWLFVGLNEEEKFSFVFSLAETISDSTNIFILGDQEKFPPFITEKYLLQPLSIESIRQAIHFLHLSSSKKKVLIVRNIEDLDFSAQNALLKTIEEPPPQAILFLLTQDEEMVLPTIVSRTKVVKLPLFNFRDYFRKRIEPQIYQLFKSGFKDGKSLRENIRIDPLIFLENLLILWRDQLLNKSSLKEFKITEIDGEIDLDFLKKALELFSLLKRYQLNPRLQIENLLFQLKKWRK